VIAAGMTLPVGRLLGEGEEPRRASSRVVIVRDEALTLGKPDEHRELLVKLLDAAMQKLTDAPDAAGAWRKLFGPKDRVGIKVNCLGLSTQPAVVDAIVAGLRQVGVPAEQIIIWDRLDTELGKAGFKLNKSGSGVQCRGTDGEHAGSGYDEKIETSGQIGSAFSRIVTQDVDVLISVPVLKDHNLAGASLGMKNFYGAIHNPNKYHDHNCDPYVADVVSHRHIRGKWRLTVCDGVRAQYNAGPGPHPGFAWSFGGLIVSHDVVAADAVAADLLDMQRKEKGLKSLADEKRPARHIATAAARRLGEGELSKIERIEV
jgi:uncharacterized protein (DUF362 family)